MKVVSKLFYMVRTLGFSRALSFAAESLTTANPIQPWNTEPQFLSLYNEIQTHTLLHKKKAYQIYQFARQSSRISGEFAEVGVYKGGTAKLIARLAPAKEVHLFDTFSGMPDTNQYDFHKKGDFDDTSLQGVHNFLQDCRNTSLYAGFFPATAGPIMAKRFAFVHIDVDIYQSVKDCCEFFYDRMTTGGIMLFDDYGFISCKGAKLAVDEFFAGKKELPCYLATGQCLVVKLPEG